jgi:hypothetical protein
LTDDDLVPGLDRHLVDGRRLEAHAGIVEDQVDAAERLGRWSRHTASSTSSGLVTSQATAMSQRTGCGGLAGVSRSASSSSMLAAPARSTVFQPSA